MYDNCFICYTPIPQFEWRRGLIVECPVCGNYEPSEYFLQKNIGSHGRFPDKHLYSGALRENYEKGIIFKLNNAKDLVDSVAVPKNPLDAVDKIMLYLAQKSGLSSGTVILTENDYSLAYAKNIQELNYFLLLARQRKYLLDSDSLIYCQITATGWEHIDEISKLQPDSNQAFVAMWFNEEIREVYENGLRPALLQTGYIPMRLDFDEHNEKIDDKIIAEIRKSGLLVADFTKQRGNVYFEAGFALGLGIPVIWTCRDTDAENLHFDTRQYNHIVWSNADDLKEKLINRIEATLPNRPKLSK